MVRAVGRWRGDAPVLAFERVIIGQETYFFGQTGGNSGHEGVVRTFFSRLAAQLVVKGGAYFALPCVAVLLVLIPCPERKSACKLRPSCQRVLIKYEVVWGTRGHIPWTRTVGLFSIHLQLAENPGA